MASEPRSVSSAILAAGPVPIATAARSARPRAILLLVIGVSMFGVMDGLGKVLGADHSVAQVVWARYAFALPVVLSLVRPANWSTLLRCERPALQALRGTLPLLASVSVITGVGLMPLADFTAIGFASPLLVVALAAPLLGEPTTRQSWIGVVCGFAGVLIIARPGAGAIAWAALLPLATALFFALYQLLTRLVSRGDDPKVTLAWTIAVGVVLTTPFLPFSWRPVGAFDWLLLALSGLLFGSGQFLLIRAYAMAPASILTPFTYAQIVSAIVFGAVVFGDIPDPWTILGMVVVILAGLYVLRRQAS
jgi:drug/metabolite transporter (DMT)-like permease